MVTTGTGDDLPHEMKAPLLHMTSAVHSHISKAETFDNKHKYAKLVKSCTGNGYRALKLIIVRSHLNYTEKPAQYLTEYLKQKKDELVFQNRRKMSQSLTFPGIL